MTKEECNAAKLYVIGEHCITAAECAKVSAKAFTAYGACYVMDVEDEKTNFDVKDNVYSCKNSKYLAFEDTDTATIAKCVDAADCT